MMTNYQNRIMNMPLGKDAPEGDSARLVYKIGHRDARHASAEILIEAEAQIGRLHSEVEALRKQQSVPEGWRLVPVEPTEAMIDATAAVRDCPVSIYYAMLDAAPKQEETTDD